jgi:hypothetical protein
MTPRSVVLGCGQEHPRVAQLHPRPHGLGTEGREERADDDARLHRAERRGIERRNAAREEEHPVSRYDPVRAQDVGETRRLSGEFGVGQDATLPLPAEPDDRGFHTVPRSDMPVDGLVRDVETAARQSFEPSPCGIPAGRHPLSAADRTAPGNEGLAHERTPLRRFHGQPRADATPAPMRSPGIALHYCR